jgi:hypothetical protein
VEITVKPLAGKKPDNYSGAVGHFTLTAKMEKPGIAATQQGKLHVIISGRGNFIQFGQPSIAWPAAFDVFDPLISDRLNKNAVPSEGKREFIFPFTCDSVGNFILPPLLFSFFDPSVNVYKTNHSHSLALEVTAATTDQKKDQPQEKESRSKSIWIAVFAIVLVAIIIVAMRRKKKEKPPAEVKREAQTDYLLLFHEINASELTVKQSCLQLQKLLSTISRTTDLTPAQKQDLHSISNEFELLIYSDVISTGKEEELKKRTLDLIRSVQQ